MKFHFCRFGALVLQGQRFKAVLSWTAVYTNIETLVVPHEDRSHPKYSGYYFVLRSDDIGKSIENLEENSREICTEKDL